MHLFTKTEAERRARELGRGYRAKRARRDSHLLWLVWCDASDHYVEFDVRGATEGCQGCDCIWGAV